MVLDILKYSNLKIYCSFLETMIEIYFHLSEDYTIQKRVSYYFKIKDKSFKLCTFMSYVQDTDIIILVILINLIVNTKIKTFYKSGGMCWEKQ